MSISEVTAINDQDNDQSDQQSHIYPAEILLDPQDYLVTPNNRYIVAKVGDRSITFPDILISEIIMLDRNAIVNLPFYETAIIGLTHHQATIMPLLLLRLLMGEQRRLINESLTVVRLSNIANDLSDQNLGGVGIIVDRVTGSLTTDEYHGGENTRFTLDDQEKLQKIDQTVANIKENEYTPIEIILSSIPTHVWQPQRWQLSK